MDAMVETIRRFNRFFTRHVGAIDTHFLGSDMTLPEARVLFEIAGRAPVLATTLQDVLEIDRGYLSRMLARFARNGLIERNRLGHDRRAHPICLTQKGRLLFETLDRRQAETVHDTLAALTPVERQDLVQSLARAQLILSPAEPYAMSIRPARTGEISLIASRQSILYAESHGWGRQLEILEAETTARFMRVFSPERENCWVAELNGVMAGAVFLTDEGDNTARLRLLHVEPFARRRGIGDSLVRTCIDFAGATGYCRVVLWTHTVLEAARRLYTRHGFTCVATAEHEIFGEPVQGEDWVLDLS